MLGSVTDSGTLSSTLISFASFVRIVDVADHFPCTIRLLFPERCLPRISKGFCPKKSQLVSLAASIRDTCQFVFFGDEIGKREGQNSAIAFVSALPESWQIVGKWFFQRGSVTQKEWKSPHKHWRFMVGLGGLEPPTSPLSVLRSLVPREEFTPGAAICSKEPSLRD
jgi:hypothetical protein